MNARTTARMVRLTESCRFIHQVRVGRRPMFGYIIRRMGAKAQAGDAYLDRAIGRYSPEVAATARAGLKKLRERFPGARQLVFERRQSLPIGFAPAERGNPVFSFVLYPRWVRFFFLEGVAIDDPKGRLEGTGNQVR